MCLTLTPLPSRNHVECWWLSTVGMEPPQLSVSEERHLAILTELPFVVQFEERVKVPVILET